MRGRECPTAILEESNQAREIQGENGEKWPVQGDRSVVGDCVRRVVGAFSVGHFAGRAEASRRLASTSIIKARGRKLINNTRS